MDGPETANFDPAIWPLTEGAHSFERHEVYSSLLLTVDLISRCAESPARISLAVFLCAPCIVQ